MQSITCHITRIRQAILHGQLHLSGCHITHYITCPVARIRHAILHGQLHWRKCDITHNITWHITRIRQAILHFKPVRYYTLHYCTYYSHSPGHITSYLTLLSPLHRILYFKSCYTLRPMWNRYYTQQKLHQDIILFEILHVIFRVMLLRRSTCDGLHKRQKAPFLFRVLEFLELRLLRWEHKNYRKIDYSYQCFLRQQCNSFPSRLSCCHFSFLSDLAILIWYLDPRLRTEVWLVKRLLYNLMFGDWAPVIEVRRLPRNNMASGWTVLTKQRLLGEKFHRLRCTYFNVRLHSFTER